MQFSKLRIGISTCLLGDNVRYNGGNKLDSDIINIFGPHSEFISICPEVESGMSTPREPMDLQGCPDNPRLISNVTHKDLTLKLQKWISTKIDELEKIELDGFIFKNKSPSCSLYPINEFEGGLFATAFKKHFPLIPVEDEVHLKEMAFKNNFIEKIFVFKRWRDLVSNSCKLADLVEFHTKHKYLLRSHDERYYSQLGRIVANTKETNLKNIIQEYEQFLIKTMKVLPTRNQNANVLIHIMGYLKKHICSQEKQDILNMIEEYKQGNYSLSVPINGINKHVDKFGITYLQKQYYLRPDPLKLLLSDFS